MEIGMGTGRVGVRRVEGESTGKTAIRGISVMS